jgi:integral membrane protein
MQDNQWVKWMRVIAILEGLSYLFILLVSMPLKYIWDMPMPNYIGGMFHGVLFMVYIAMIIPVARVLSWDFKTSFIAALASIIPFGTFWFERKFLK